MPKLFVGILIALVLSGCDTRVNKPDAITGMAAANNMRYIQDNKTGLCFAVLSATAVTDVNSRSLTITWVPCDPKVLQEIRK